MLTAIREGKKRFDNNKNQNNNTSQTDTNTNQTEQEQEQTNDTDTSDNSNDNSADEPSKPTDNSNKDNLQKLREQIIQIVIETLEQEPKLTNSDLGFEYQDWEMQIDALIEETAINS